MKIKPNTGATSLADLDILKLKWCTVVHRRSISSLTGINLDVYFVRLNVLFCDQVLMEMAHALRVFAVLCIFNLHSHCGEYE